MTLFLPVGAPGSGKSTVARKHFTPDVIVSPDDYRLLLTGDRSNQEENARVFVICNTIAQARIEHGLDVWFDATNLPIPHGLVAHAKLMNALVVYVLFPMDEGELRLRNEYRPKNEWVPGHVLTKYLKLYNEQVPTLHTVRGVSRTIEAENLGGILGQCI